MVKVKTSDEVMQNYQREDIAGSYIRKRFVTPIGKAEHAQQIDTVNRLIEKQGLRTALDLACGPARITRDIKGIKSGIAIDSSENMLKIAKILMKDNPHWKFKKADILKLKLNKKFDLVTTFRFIFHFNKPQREIIYKVIKNSLKRDGFLVFDAKNIKKAKKIKALVKMIHGKNRYKVYQKLYTKQELISELRANGFSVLKMDANINHFYSEVFVSKLFNFLKLNKLGYKLIMMLEKIKSRNPLYWTVIAKNEY